MTWATMIPGVLEAAAEPVPKSLGDMFAPGGFRDFLDPDLICFFSACAAVLFIVAGLVLLLVGLVKRRKGLWVTGLVLGLVGLLAIPASDW